MAIALPVLAGAGLAVTADIWLGLAPAVVLATMAGAVLGSGWGLAVRSKHRVLSGILAMLGLIAVVLVNGYVLSQPRYRWRQVRTLVAWHTGEVTSVAFSPGGETLASGSGDTMRLWRVSDGTLLRTLETHWATSVAFSPDGATLASVRSYYDNTVRLWRVWRTGRCCAPWKGTGTRCTAWPFPPTGHCWPRGRGIIPCGCGGWGMKQA